MGGQPSESKKRRTEVRIIRRHLMPKSASFVEEHMELMSVPNKMIRRRMSSVMYVPSWTYGNQGKKRQALQEGNHASRQEMEQNKVH